MAKLKEQQDDQGQELPGYPHYSADEDITNPANGKTRVDADVEQLANSARLSSLAANRTTDAAEGSEAQDTDDDEDIRIVPGTEADVTAEDLVLLGDKDADQDMNDDESIEGNSRVDFVESEDDLDVPGSDLDSGADEMNSDEENNYYSLGGDRHENLDEDPAGGNQDQ